ncbi:hypothetical protein [Streptomyces sp. NPDC050287]|uniref:hypothetical protein n=1 Tax=Streptomyces sp. NPDC050287 TaxID=3365608 RepID=UPI00378AE025
MLPADLGERAMIGDTGAHALGAALEAAVVASRGRARPAVHAAALIAVAVYGPGERGGEADASSLPYVYTYTYAHGTLVSSLV